MLYAFGFERVGVLVGDLYFVDPRPAKGQEGDRALKEDGAPSDGVNLPR